MLKGLHFNYWSALFCFAHEEVNRGNRGDLFCRNCCHNCFITASLLTKWSFWQSDTPGIRSVWTDCLESINERDLYSHQ